MRLISWLVVLNSFSQQYAMYELDKLTEAYAQGWDKFGVARD
jgi:hypothetical protein